MSSGRLHVLMEDSMIMERRNLLSGESDNDEQNPPDEGVDYEDAISATGYGKFQYWLVGVGGFANASDAIEILCISILLPAAQCDLHMTSVDKGLLVALVFVGMMIGGYVWGCLEIYMAEKYSLLFLLVNSLAGIISSSLSEFFSLFITMRFISGLGVGGSIPLVWAYISEFQPADKRGGALSVIAAFWMVGNILVAALGLAIIPHNIGFVNPTFSYNSWRIFLTLCAVPSLLIAVVMLWLPESPMFLLTKGKHKEAIAILQGIYSCNSGKSAQSFPVSCLSFIQNFHFMLSASPTSLSNREKTVHSCGTFLKDWDEADFLHVATSDEFFIYTVRKPNHKNDIIWAANLDDSDDMHYRQVVKFPEYKWHQFELFFFKTQVSVCELTTFHGNSTSVDCDSDNLVDPQALVNTLITASSAFPANVWTIFCMDKLGRKFFLVFSMVLSGIAAFGIYFVKSSTDNLILGCVFGAVSTMGFNALDCLGAELFPTHLRSTALAVTLLSARIGAIVGNIVFGTLIDVHCAIPMFLVAILLIGGGLLGLLLPNTTRVALK
ncbi:LOW QUALITY PROTEIN: synaptic vesicle glycoprotein 2B-like [Macrobrachium rosenbergii]|uniref:LOW QUALITY PROTEIN: synaptic vesicle glycoprotein 2B-like n=1 Tax=Macrobrachium rosenbergii TaxID=79674 RepID=UPI0034D6210D